MISSVKRKWLSRSRNNYNTYAEYGSSEIRVTLRYCFTTPGNFD